MIQNVIRLEAKFELQTIGDRGIFKNGEVKLAEMRSAQGVAAFVSEMSSAGLTAVGETVARNEVGTGNGKRRQIKKIARIIRVMDWTGHVRAAEEFAAAVVVVLKVVVQVEGLSGLDGHNSIQSPAVSEFLPTAAAVREFVDEVPCEAVAHVEIGIAPIEADRRRAVVWLGRSEE